MKPIHRYSIVPCLIPCLIGVTTLIGCSSQGPIGLEKSPIPLRTSAIEAKPSSPATPRQEYTPRFRSWPPGMFIPHRLRIVVPMGRGAYT